ncbi:MAG: hypothetical protein KAI24_00350 [Planctomycetes bacterium]|nr:hypothetical protein [Planctomycetota bacterium]
MPYRSPLLSALLIALGAAVLTGSPLAQKRKDDEVAKLSEKGDPYTKNDPEAMAALGVERYGPFPWADHFGTADIDKVLGPGRVLWMETRHFRIGLNMTTARLPEDSSQKKAVYAECKALHKRWRKIPAKPKKLGPWLQLHLYAARCEAAYAEFQQLVGCTDESFDKTSKANGKGPYLGAPDKHLLLLFQKKSDMARYMKRFCDTEAEDSFRFVHKQTHQPLLCVSVEGMEGFDAQGIHGHVVFALWQNLMNIYRGFHYPLPLWFSTGLAHYYSRQIESEFVNARIRDTEAVDQASQNEWYEKVWKRSRHEGATIAFEQLAAMHDWQTFGFHAHTQAWSRLEFLMERDRQKVGLMLDKMKRMPASGDWEGDGARLRKMMPKLLYEAFELDGPTFDAEWREWVLKVYPKRK